MFKGDLYDEEDVLDWLTSPENMELNDAIEKVNRKMFDRIRQSTDYLAVYFCKYFVVLVGRWSRCSLWFLALFQPHLLVNKQCFTRIVVHSTNIFNYRIIFDHVDAYTMYRNTFRTCDIKNELPAYQDIFFDCKTEVEGGDILNVLKRVSLRMHEKTKILDYSKIRKYLAKYPRF